MRRTSRLLRASVVFWLIFQLAAHSAVLQGDCCTRDGPERPGCHETASARQCPMRSADGTPCPMHRAAVAANEDHHGTAHTAHEPSRTDDCVMRGTCPGPAAAFLVLLTTPGVLPAPTVPTFLTPAIAGVHSTEAQPLGLLTPPDPPPPRG